MTVQLSWVWHVRPNKGSFIKVEYREGDAYPVVHEFFMPMPEAFVPVLFDADLPVVVPILSGMDVNWRSRSDPAKPSEHPLRQVRVDLQNDGFTIGGEVGPNMKAVVGLRDNSGEPPDDPFDVWLHVSALVIFDFTVDAEFVGLR